jgi:DNA-binding transcriptional LysR family regulator
MELRHLRYFLAVAEELHFTRAAERLGISQPPLTQQVKALEAELGVALFVRSAYRIERSAMQAARRAATGVTGRVRVGFTESASFNSLVTSTLRAFRSDFAAVEVSLEEHPSTDLITALREGRIDAAFVRPPVPTRRGLALDLLEREPLLVAVPSGHRLATRQEIDLGSLAAETFILYPRAVRPGLADTVVAACESAGFTPKVGQYAPQLSSTINLVAASLGISIVPDSMRCLQAHAVTYVPLRGEPLHALLGIAYRTDEGSAAVYNFIEAARRGRSPAVAGSSTIGRAS